jgi:tetratricopeptide (TPR) repeat protein
VARNWHPITMLTHMADCQFFGLNPRWPHFVNLLYHIANSVLLFHLLRRMTGALWRSAVVAAFFALHPLHVESVAWVAERKDVLSTFFWLLTTWAYVRYTAERTSKSRYFYALALVFFALGLMSKPMLVTLPFTLLLWDHWPLARGSMWRLIWEKIPFFLLSAGDCVVTYAIQQHGGSVLNINNLSIGDRLGNALISYVRYIGKMAWPEGLAGLYLKTHPWPLWQVALAALLLAAVSIGVIQQLRPRPWLAVGWFWYLGTLVPVIGLVQVGMQTMADRYTYVPLIGLFLILAWAGAELAVAWRARRFAASATLFLLAACAVVTRHQIAYWHDSETLFKRMIDATPNNFMAHYNLGNVYSRQMRTNDAIAQYTAALEGEPNYADAHNNLGGIYLDEKKYDEALEQYRAAIRTNPDYPHYLSLANALADAASAQHDAAGFAEAVQTYQTALQLNPASSEAHHNLGLTWQVQGRENEALAEFEQAVQLNPSFLSAQMSLATALYRANHLNDAGAHYKVVTDADPTRVDAWNGLAMCDAMLNKMGEAADAFRAIIRLQPNDAGAYGNIGNALAAQNKLAESIPFYLTALKLNSNDCQTEFNLGLTLSRQGRRAEAEAHYRQALRINPNYTEAQRALKAEAEPPQHH